MYIKEGSKSLSLESLLQLCSKTLITLFFEVLYAYKHSYVNKNRLKMITSENLRRVNRDSTYKDDSSTIFKIRPRLVIG